MFFTSYTIWVKIVPRKVEAMLCHRWLVFSSLKTKEAFNAKKEKAFV